MKYRHMDASLPIEERVQSLLSLMTLEEKAAQLDMLRGSEYTDRPHPIDQNSIHEQANYRFEELGKKFGGVGIGFIHDNYGAPDKANQLQRFIMENHRLHIPAIFTGEALHGIAYPGASVFPTPLGLAASFDRDNVHQVGKRIGAETRAIGIHNIFAPNLDIGREPRWGRTEETFGEDTYLASEMAYQIVTGEQGDKLSDDDAIISEVKHYCGHGVPEGGLNCAPTHAGVREVETEFLPVYEAAIARGGAYCAMASYNCIDSEVMIASKHYLTEVLRDRYGMPGFVRSDFGAVKRLQTLHMMTDNDMDSIEMAFNSGLDVQGFDFPNEVWQQGLCTLVREGRITEERLNEAVGRVLRAKFALGLFEHPFADEEAYKTILRGDVSRAVNQRAADEGLVLLKNDGLLPLSKEVRSVAVLGPGAQEQRIGGYSSKPFGYEIPTVAQEVAALLPDAEVRAVSGCGVRDYEFMPIPRAWYDGMVKICFYEHGDFTSDPVGRMESEMIHFNWAITKPHASVPMQGYGASFEGDFVVTKQSLGLSYRPDASLAFHTSDSVRVWLDGELLIDSVGAKKQQMPRARIPFKNGEKHHFRIEYVLDTSGSEFALGVCSGESAGIEAAVEAAKQSDAVIVVVGDDTSISGECRDRAELKLFGQQQELVRAVAKTGKPFALVTVIGRPADLTEESELANAILNAWYGGEWGARAIVRALFGEFSPCGKLPISFPRGVGRLPDYYSRLPGKNTHYIEGSPDALYPFGFGLTYTSFAYSDLALSSDAPGTIDVKFAVTNAGSCDSCAIPQVYVRDVCSSVVTPMKLLKGFERVALAAGETKQVTIRLEEQAFRLFGLDMKWKVEPGWFEIMVGDASNDIRLMGRVQLDENKKVIACSCEA